MESVNQMVKSLVQKIVILVIILLPVFDTSASTQIGSLCYNLDSSTKTAQVTHSNYTFSSIEIPEKINYNGITYTVTTIGYQAFKGSVNLSSIKFPNTIETIGSDAFYKCNALISVVIPNSVISIKAGAFWDCSKLKNLQFSSDSRIQNIDDFAFSGCANLENVDFPASITSIGKQAFSLCSKLTQVILPKNITLIGEAAFYKCSALEDVYIPKSLHKISDGAFSVCPNMKNITIEEGVEVLGSDAFVGDFEQVGTYGPTKIDCVILPPSIKTIGSGNFPESNIVLFNGSVSLYPAMDSNYYILDAQVPTIQERSTTSVFYFYDRDVFLTKSGMYSFNVKQLNDGIESISLPYNGLPQGPNRNTMPWAIGETLKSFGINYNFQGVENTDCGEWHGEEQVTFQYGDWTFTSPILYNYKITPIPLELSIPEYTKEYGEENPEIELKAEGFVGNDNIENSLEGLSIICSASKESKVGTYTIKMLAESNNYSLSYNFGKLTIKKAPLKITVNDAQIKYGDSIPQIELSYSGFKLNDNEVTAFSQTPSTNLGNLLKNDVGTYEITASGGVSKNYEITEYRPGTLTITKAPLTLTANNAERSYYTENPPFDYTITGLVNNDDASCITTQPTYFCTATISSDCGQYIITPSGAFAKNYNITYKEGMLKILPILLTLIPTDAFRYYGDANSTVDFSFIAEGLKGDDTLETVFTKVPEISTAVNESSEVGEYPVTISNGEANNYTLAYLPGKLTILKAPLTVTASDETRVYGQTNPLLGLSYDGFKLGENEQIAFVEKPSATTDANINSDAGVYPITASGGVAKNYEVTEYIPGNLTVIKAPLTISADNAERLYHSENPEFDFTLTGLVNNDDRTCLSKMPDVVCDATVESACGEYGIIPSNAEAKNYDISYKAGVLKVTKAPLNISVKDCSRKYGDANPRFEFIYSGLKEGEDAASVLSQLPVATCSARANSQVGYYDIEVSGAESPNYEITYTPGILTVEKAPLTIRPKDLSRIYGQTNPEFEISYMGFKNNEDESVLFRAPQVSTTATEKSPTGQYPITASGASAQNYEIDYEQGVLTITKNILKVIVNDAAKFYGDANPQFTVRYDGLLNGDTENVITTKPQFITEATAKSNAGVYDVTAYGASSPQYDIEYKSGNLTVNPRGISAKVGNYNRPYGTDNPEFVVDYTGFVNGDDKTDLTEPSTVTCEADKNSNVGTYVINVAGGRGQNYEVTSFTNGILTVEKANQTIEWSQDLSSINQYNQIELTAIASSGLPVTYDVASNNVVDIYTSGGKTFLDCYGTGTVTIRATQQGNENYNPSETITNKLTVVSEGGYVDPSTPNISINVTTAGTLPSKIAESKKYQIKSLTITGNLNGTDIRYLREMAGRDVNGSKTNGILEKLDLSRATIVSGGDYYYTTNSSSSYNSYRKYTSNNQISDYMFYGCSTLTNLTLPQDITAIGAHAFDGCLNLSNIGMSDRIQTIGESAFNGDISLTRISIPDQTTAIGNYAFQGCSGLTTLILSSSVKTIGDGMLNGCLNIQEISLNSENTYYSTLNGVLYNKAQTSLIIYPAGKLLQTFEIPDGVTEIKSSGFFGTKALEYLFLPESLTIIGADAFKGCSNLKKLFARPSMPAECANDCFEAVSKSNCALYVPRGSYNDYWAAPVWGEFLKIEESNDLSVGGNIAKPDYGFEFPETTLNKGKFTYIPVAMNNVDPVVAFNCDIVLPEGVAFYKDSNDQIVFKPSERFPLSQNINSNLLPNGVLRVISTSSTNEAFSGTEGVLFYLPLLLTDTNANEDSEYSLIVKNIEFSRKNQSGYSSVQSPDITVLLTVGEYTMGDANGDGRITGADAVLAMSNFLGKETPNIIMKAADMNYDGKISGIDVVLITDELLSQNQSSKTQAGDANRYKGNLLMTGNASSSTEIALNFSVPNAYEFTAIQMDVTIPDGFTVKNMKIGPDNQVSHSLKYRQHPNGMTRVFIYSDSNADFISDNILSIELDEVNTIHDSQEITVEDVLAVEITDDGVLEWNICGDETNVSEIAEICMDSNINVWVENSTIYINSNNDGVISLCDISGNSRSIEFNAGTTSISVLPGIYLINNKKIIVK